MQELSDKQIVLVVDDSPESLGMINMALDNEGMAVLVSLNGQQAINVLDQVTPDVILLDAVMPVMDGFECAVEIRKRLPLTPIIFMTGLSDEKDIVRAFEAGGTDYIVKPIKPQELLVRIRQRCDNANMLRTARQVLDEARQHVFCIDSLGNILWTTPDAQKLINNFIQSCNGNAEMLRQKLQSWLPVGMEGSDLALPCENDSYTVHYFRQSREDEFLLKLQASSSSVSPSLLESELGITHREAEVLLWVAHGKTNREIADILEMSPRTVNKHLEQMYNKIGADNRTAAASIALQAIFGGKIGRPARV